MKEVEDILRRELPSGGSVFVFPSEVAASFWAGESLNLGVNAVLTERFISWDRFKEKNFNLTRDALPVNRYIRTLFSAALIAENKTQGSFLRSVIRPEYADSSDSFVSRIAEMLPGLGYLFTSGERLPDSFPGDILSDYREIYTRYKTFLDTRGFFEPSWISEDVQTVSDAFFIFFPEVISDFREFRSGLEKNPGIRIVELSKPERNRIDRYRSASAEIRSLLFRVGELLDSGTGFSDIVITLPDSKNWIIPLKTEAALRAIPLDVREGDALIALPGGRMFSDIINCGKSGFSMDSMKQALPGGAIPWKDPASASELIRFGLEHSCLLNYYASGRRVDVWEEALSSGPKNELSDFYRTFRNSVERIISSSDFNTLSGNVQKFINILVDTDNMPEDTLREMQFALDIINDLQNAAELCGITGFGQPADIWLSFIKTRIYVKRSKTAGISVYPYRVSAGINPEWHFLPGFSQRAAQVAEDRLPFLKDNLKVLVSSAETDYSEQFLDLYEKSGKNVVFSCSELSFGGPELPPSRFVAAGAVETRSSAEYRDEFRLEAQFWKGDVSDPGRIFPVMKKGFASALETAFKPKSSDYTKDSIISEYLRDAVSFRFMNEDGKLLFSPTGMELFFTCPYQFMMSRAAGADELDYDVSYLDQRIFGRILHTSLEKFTQLIQRSGGMFSASRIDEYREYISSTVDEAVRYSGKKGIKLIPPVQEYCRRFAENSLGKFLDTEAAVFDGYSLRWTEKEFFADDPDSDVVLHGTVDRVSDNGDVTVLVDYKKKLRLTKKAIDPADPGTGWLQIPFYLKLLEENSHSVEIASYYDITGAGYVHFTGPEEIKPWFSAEETGDLKSGLVKAVRVMSDKIRKGQYQTNTEGCRYCSLRRVCREKFSVRQKT